ncbi:MAG: hypothetical protein GX621_13755, partial [Pirellulaceae bacterium]|nr:hypothetical protein [Pirellulaceae bacterium]
MSSPLPVRLTSLDAAGNGPDVEFTWLDDRFVHAVYFVSEGNCMLVAEQVVESPELGVALVELHPQLD